MTPTVTEKNGTLTYTNYKGTRRVSIIALIAGSIIVCTAILQFLGVIKSSESDPDWLKSDVCMLAMFLGFAVIAIVQGIHLFRHRKSYYITLAPDSLQSNLYGKAQSFSFRDIDEVRRTPGDSVIKIYCARKCGMQIPDWFLGSQAREFEELLKNRMKRSQ